MPSSSRPYKSKLLRFVLQQWQQGLNRQDRTWRKLKSTATWGAQVALLPIYVITRAVERANFVLDSSNTSSESSPTREPIIAAKNHVTDIEHSFTAILTHTQQLLSSEQKRRLAIAQRPSLIRQTNFSLLRIVKQIRDKITSNLQPSKKSSIKRYERYSKLLYPNQAEHTSTHLQSFKGKDIKYGDHKTSSDLVQHRTTLASSLKDKNLVLVNAKNEIFDIFTPSQQSELRHYITCIINAYEQSLVQSKPIASQQTKRSYFQTTLTLENRIESIKHPQSLILRRTQKLLSLDQKGKLAVATPYAIVPQAQDSLSTKTTPDLIQNGTTLASSLNNRKLVLVNSKNQLFDILTPTQQVKLSQFIVEVMRVYQQSSPVVSRQPKSLSAQTIVAISAAFITALPVEFRKAWAQVAPSSKELSLPPLDSNNPQPKSRIFYPTPATKTKAHAYHPSGKMPHSNHNRQLSSNDPYAFETNVNGVSYIEHPLEKVLRWIDRILTWCERRWQKWLKQI